MLWTIAKKDFLLHLMTFRFAVGTTLGIVLVLAFVPVLAQEYQQRSQEHAANVAANEAALRRVMVYKNIAPTVYRPPSLLAVFSEGLEKQLGVSVKIERAGAPQIGTASTEVNPYLSVFPALDVSLVLQVVFSALALLVGYDVISGEREQETLRLILSGGTPRGQVLFGKLLAGLLILIVPVTVVFLLALLLLFPQRAFSPSDWAQVGLMYLASLLFLAAMFQLGLCFSCLTRHSAVSLVLGLLVWLLCVVVVPNGSIGLATRLRPLEPPERFERPRREMQQEYLRQVRALRSRFPGCSGPKSDAADAFGQFYPVLCAPSCLQALSQCSPLEEAVNLRYGDRLWDLELASLGGLLRQTQLARNLARVSPVCVYANAMAALARSDLPHFRRFLDSARTYRHDVLAYLRAQTADFSSYAYFTTCGEAEATAYAGLFARYEKATDEAGRQGIREALRRLQDRRQAETRSLDLRGLPRFVYRPGVAGSLRQAGPDLLLLVFVNALLLAVSFAALVRYDVR